MEQEHEKNSPAPQAQHTASGNSSPLLEEREVCGALKARMVTTKPKPSSTTDWIDATPTLDMNGMSKKEACPLLEVDTISPSLCSSSTHNVWYLIKHYGKHKKQEQTPTHFQEIKHSRKPECEVTQMLEPSDRDIRMTMIHMLKELVEKVDSMHEQTEM